MSLILPHDAVARKYVSAGLRGQAEAFLRVIRGRISTTTPTILQGKGFTVAKNSTGDVTITFTTAFDGVPAVIATPQAVEGYNIVTAMLMQAPTTTTARIRCTGTSGGTQTDVDTVFSFVAVAVLE